MCCSEGWGGLRGSAGRLRVALSVVNEALWANYPHIYLASVVGVIVSVAGCCSRRAGLVNIGIKRWRLTAGRPPFVRRLAWKRPGTDA